MIHVNSCLAAPTQARDPNSELEQELLDNAFDLLCSALMLPANQDAFVRAEGVELMVLILGQPRAARLGAIKAMDFATTRRGRLDLFGASPPMFLGDTVSFCQSALPNLSQPRAVKAMISKGTSPTRHRWLCTGLCHDVLLIVKRDTHLGAINKSAHQARAQP